MNRRGISLLEMTVASVLLAALMTICLQMLQVTAAARRANWRRQTAIREAANVMERLAVTPWEDLTPQRAEGVQLSPPARRMLPGGKLQIELTGPAGQPGTKRIAVSIRWQDRTGEFLPPVRLVAWRYQGIGDG